MSKHVKAGGFTVELPAPSFVAWLFGVREQVAIVGHISEEGGEICIEAYRRGKKLTPMMEWGSGPRQLGIPKKEIASPDES